MRIHLEWLSKYGPLPLLYLNRLSDCDVYVEHYVWQGGNPSIPSKNDGEDFTGILAALDVLGFTADETDTVFSIVAAVLHLGNVYFGKSEVRVDYQFCKCIL